MPTHLLTDAQKLKARTNAFNANVAKMNQQNVWIKKFADLFQELSTIQLIGVALVAAFAFKFLFSTVGWVLILFSISIILLTLLHSQSDLVDKEFQPIFSTKLFRNGKKK